MRSFAIVRSIVGTRTTFFDEWAKPCHPLSSEAEQVLGLTNERLAHCRSTDVVLEDFLAFMDG